MFSITKRPLHDRLWISSALSIPLDNVELYSRSLKASAKRGKVDQIMSTALDDGVIEKREADAIIAALIAYMSARYAEVFAAIQLYSQGAVQ